MKEVLEKIIEIAQKASTCDYFYRGETRANEYVSSKLFRDSQKYSQQDFDIEGIQMFELEEARKYTHETDEYTILTQIQHYGGSTNLIDFTTDCLVALFFASDGDYDCDGRLILLKKNSTGRLWIHKPRSPENRVVAQKSIFMRPPKVTSMTTATRS